MITYLKSLLTPLVIIYSILYAPGALSAGVALIDFSGQTGPAPPPAPYATTTLLIENAPNDVAQFMIEINYGKGTLSGYYCRLKEPFKSWQYCQVGHKSSSTRNAYYIDCQTSGAPISAGSTLEVAEISFVVEKNETITLSLEGLQHDIEGWSTKDAIFSPLMYGLAPVAIAGTDQIVENMVYLDGRQSYDSDGSIVEYNWQIIHRENPEFNITTSGPNPRVYGLKRGFYRVTLTVTDNTGLIGKDYVEIASTGSKKKIVVIPIF